MSSQENKTITYYNKMSDKQGLMGHRKECEKNYQRFMEYLRKGAHILDLGCGYGYDSKYFMENGYLVTPVDGSKSRCQVAEEYIGIPVIEASFEQYHPDTFFDAVWSVNALVHVSREELVPIINHVTRTLKPHGIFFLSVPYGDFEGVKEGRFYSYLNEDWLEDAEMHLNGLRVAECHIEEHHDEEGKMGIWLSVLMVKE